MVVNRVQMFNAGLQQPCRNTSHYTGNTIQVLSGNTRHYECDTVVLIQYKLHLVATDVFRLKPQFTEANHLRTFDNKSSRDSRDALWRLKCCQAL